VGDPIQPTRQRGPAADGGCLAGQDEEGGLENVLGVLLVVKHPATQVEDHRAVPPYENGKRLHVFPAEKGVKEFLIRPDSIARCSGYLPDVMEQRAKSCVGHGRSLSYRCQSVL
jgi:hypothetical protein